jgi:hypothetical protein
MSDTKIPIATQIQEIFEQNQIEDLKRMMSRRHSLNNCNIWLIYMFHLVQSGGILTTTIATGYSFTYLIWVGVGLNILATLLNVYEKTNANLSKKLLTDIESIKAGKYTDEGSIEQKPENAAATPPTNHHSTVLVSLPDKKQTSNGFSTPLLTSTPQQQQTQQQSQQQQS